MSQWKVRHENIALLSWRGPGGEEYDIQNCVRKMWRQAAYFKGVES